MSARRAAIRRRSDRWKLGGLGVGATGLLGLAAGFYFGQRAGALADDVSIRYDASKAAQGRLDEQVQIASLVAGGVFAAAGAVLIYVGWRAGKRSPRLVIAPTAESGGAAVILTGGW